MNENGSVNWVTVIVVVVAASSPVAGAYLAWRIAWVLNMCG